MKTIVLLTVLLVPSVASAADWSLVFNKIKDSVVYVESNEGSCTAFVIDEEKDLVLTAAHCYADVKELYVDKKPVGKIVHKDTKKDLMVLHVPDIDRPSIALAKDDPKIGDEVASYGYGYGLEQPFFKAHHVMGSDIHINEQGIGGPLVGVDTSYDPGMSGGPLVNTSGELVGIVQMGNDSIGFGVGTDTLRDKVGRYFSTK